MLKGQNIENACVVRIFGEGSSLKAFLLKGLSRVAFTMAEILLSLTIIGVVAAITLPSLTGNINERTWNTQRKALFARVSQAVSLMDSMRGFGTVIQTQSPNESGWGAVYSSTNAGESFVTAGLSKVLKLNNVCDYSHLSDCGLPSQVINMVGSKISLTSMQNLTDLHYGFSALRSGQSIKVYNKNAAFETANGESILLAYNPLCKGAEAESEYTNIASTNVICANLIYDLNGKKGPNTVGKDVGFISVFYPSDPVVVAPVPQAKPAGSVIPAQAAKLCTNSGDGLKLPNLEELMSVYTNYKFIDENFESKGSYFATSTKRTDRWNSTPTSMALSFEYGGSFGSYGSYYANTPHVVWCINR